MTERGTFLTMSLTAALLLAPNRPVPLEAQQVVPVHQEPRHRLLVEEPGLRVLDVQIQAGDTTLFHTHSTPITYVTAGRSHTGSQALGGEWRSADPTSPLPGTVGQIRGVLRYAERPLTHRVTNVGSGLFRLIAITNEGPGDDDAPASDAPGTTEAESRWFRHARMDIAPDASSGWHTATDPAVLVLVAAGRVAVDTSDDWLTTMEDLGDVVTIEAGGRFRVRNAGNLPVQVVLVEVR